MSTLSGEIWVGDTIALFLGMKPQGVERDVKGLEQEGKCTERKPRRDAREAPTPTDPH